MCVCFSCVFCSSPGSRGESDSDSPAACSHTGEYLKQRETPGTLNTTSARLTPHLPRVARDEMAVPLIANPTQTTSASSIKACPNIPQNPSCHPGMTQTPSLLHRLHRLPPSFFSRSRRKLSISFFLFHRQLFLFSLTSHLKSR